MKKQRKPQLQNDDSKPAVRKSRRLAPIGVLVVAAIAAGLGVASSYRSPSLSPGSAPAGMKWIPGGEFTMGTDDANSMPNERPAHRVHLDGYWIDETPVTNVQFRKFVEATGYLTTAERPVDWEELKKQVPPGTPKPPDVMLKPGSLVFTPPDHPVDSLLQSTGPHPFQPGATISVASTKASTKRRCVVGRS